MTEDRLKILGLDAALLREEEREAALPRSAEGRSEVSPAPPPYRLLWCQIAYGAPGDPPDERYYADEVRPQEANESGHMEWEAVPGGLQGLVVHNIAEAGMGSHTLPQGMVVRVEERLDHGDPPDMVYLACAEMQQPQKLGRIVSYDDGTYTVQPVRMETGSFVDDGPPISGVPNLGELWPDEAGYMDGPAGYDRYVELLGGSGRYAFILHPPRMV
jgi:hypothetical protein